MLIEEEEKEDVEEEVKMKLLGGSGAWKPIADDIIKLVNDLSKLITNGEVSWSKRPGKEYFRQFFRSRYCNIKATIKLIANIDNDILHGSNPLSGMSRPCMSW